MFRKIWNWFGFGRSGFRDRVLFHYRDGTRARTADPVAVEDRLVKHLGPDWFRVVGALSEPFPPGLAGEALDAERDRRAADRKKAVAAICAAFNVTEYDNEGRGLTIIELFGLLDGYCRYAAALLEYARPFVSAQSRASPSPENPPVPNGPDSTLAGTPSPEPVIAT